MPSFFFSLLCTYSLINKNQIKSDAWNPSYYLPRISSERTYFNMLLFSLLGQDRQRFKVWLVFLTIPGCFLGRLFDVFF